MMRYALVLLCLAACQSTGEPHVAAQTPQDSTVTFVGANEPVVYVEIADSPEERSQGLMYRQEMAADRGMVFVFPNQQIHAFWMRNTYISLDMIFVDQNRQVVGVVANAEPLTDTSRSVGVPSKYVIEVVAGYAAAHEITAGTTVRFANVPAQVEQ